MALLVTGSTGSVWAQQPRYERPPPPTKNVTVDVRMKYLLSPDVSFGGLGNVPFSAEFATENNLLLGTERAKMYDDGYLTQDYISASLVEGQDGGQRLPSSNTDATSSFQVSNPDQLPEDDPDSILFHRYASGASPDEEVDADYSGNINWEINYTRYFNARRRFGMQVGFGVTGFDSTFKDTVSADLYIQQFRHEISQGTRPELSDPVEGSDGSTTQAPYTGSNTRADVDSGDLVDWLAAEESEQTIADGAIVNSSADLRSSMYNFKAGPVYNLNVFRRVSLQLAAGVSAVYYNGSFSVYEVLNIPDMELTPSRGLATSDASEWQVGGYVDANARYQLSDRMNVFSGVQVHSGSAYSQQNEEREVNIDFSSQIFVHAGFGIRF